MKNVLIMNLNWRELVEIGRMPPYEPLVSLELMYISASMDRLKINNRLIDLWGLNKSIYDFEDLIKKSDILVMCSAPSYHFWQDGAIDIEFPKKRIKEIKKINKDIKIIIVGPHGSVLPHTFFDSPVDFIVRGEPDIVTATLTKQIINKKKFTLDGVCYKKNNKWIIAKSQSIVKDLTKLPQIPYEKVNIDNYIWPVSPGHYNLKRVTVYEASRGCPFDCIFCFRMGFRGKLRFKSIKQIQKELDIIKKLNIDYTYLIDETLAANKKWTKQVCNELKKRNLTWGCEINPKYINKEIIDLLAKSGCIEIRIGLESANKKILEVLGKGYVNLKKLKENVDHMIKKGIYVKFFCITGSPCETKETIKQTLDYVLQFPLSKLDVSTNLMLPFPNTILWNMGIKEGKNLKNWKDIPKYSGIIGNQFKTPKDVLREVARFNAKIQDEKAKLQILSEIKKRTKMHLSKILKYSAVRLGCYSLMVFPQFFDSYIKFYRYLKGFRILK